MKYVFYLSGEEPKLALAELKALFETYGLKFNIKSHKGHVLIIDSKATEAQVKRLSERSAMLKFSGTYIYTAKSLLLKEFEKVKWRKWVKSPFCVRVEDLTGTKDPLLEGRLASPIWWSLKRPSVNLTNPKTTIYAIVDKKLTYIIRLIWKAPKGRFKNREPSKKPAFHPTALKPKLARALVNLARAKEGTTILDPFCGTGSIPIEAAIIGCRVIGSDLNKIMVKGSKTNLEFYKKLYKYKKYKLLQANALELEKHFKPNSINAISTDPPYGRSSHIGAPSLKALYKGFMSSAHSILKKNKYMTLIYPHYAEIKPLINKRQWKITDSASWYIHGGLTRKILVLKKK